MDTHKLKAASIAISLVQSGMVVGLGSGRTATLALQILARKLNDGKLEQILGIPSSLAIEQHAKQLGIPLINLEEHPVIDITIDGADEVDEDLNLIKGGGGALLREKIIAQASRREIIIVDQSKLSEVLGTQWPVPIEVLPFGWGSQAKYLESLGGRWKLRKNLDGSSYLTDQGNLILDCDFGLIKKPRELSNQLADRAGIIEHGLFIELASDLIVVGKDGCRHITSSSLKSKKSV